MTEKEALSKVRALKLALEALECALSDDRPYIVQCKEAITAIKEALSQPEQEQLMSDQINYGMSVTQGGKRIDPMSIYKEPEHDKTDVRCECCGYMTYHREHLGCIRAAKLKEPEQEPVAWRWKYKFKDIGETGAYEYHSHEFACLMHMPKGEPLYTSPPQRKPLTDEEIRQVMKSLGWTGEAPSDIEFARAIEAAVWEKQK